LGGADHGGDRRCSNARAPGPGCQATDLSVAQAVKAESEDLARDRDLGDLLAAPTVSGFGDFSSTALMFSYRLVAFSGSEA
jgi:hypothetical protein